MPNKVLGRVPTLEHEKWLKRLLKDAYDPGRWGNGLGEVEPVTLKPDEPAALAIDEIAGVFGYQHREVRLFADRCYLPINGSVRRHDDGGLGLLLCWLVSKRPLLGYGSRGRPTEDHYSVDDPELIVDRDVIVPSVGSVFVFNADANHAWVHNGRSVLIQLSVSPIRSPKGK